VSISFPPSPFGFWRAGKKGSSIFKQREQKANLVRGKCRNSLLRKWFSVRVAAGALRIKTQKSKCKSQKYYESEAVVFLSRNCSACQKSRQKKAGKEKLGLLIFRGEIYRYIDLNFELGAMERECSYFSWI